MRFRRFAIVAMLTSGCWKAEPASPIPRVTRDPQVAFERALRTLHGHRPLDYSLPFQAPPTRRDLAKQFHEPCLAGNHRACWIEAEYSGASYREGDYTLVAANCRAGDHDSCRALPAPFNGRSSFPDLPGGMGRSAACNAIQTEDCDEQVLRDECDAGFLSSCLSMPDEEEAGDDLDHRNARIEKLAEENCVLDIAESCVFANEEVEMRTCELTDDCIGLSMSAAKAGDLIGARNALERQCQYTRTRAACAALAEHYSNREWEEPIPNRGEDLEAWVCSTLEAGDEGMFHCGEPDVRYQRSP